MGVIERVHPLVAPILADLGLELYDLEHAGGTLKVVLDRTGGVDLEDLALATRLISRQLDHTDPIPGRYTLEVTSPGLERALRTPEHFARAVGTKVNVRTLPHVAGDRRLEGVLVAVDEDRITLRVDDVGAALGAERTLALADVERARTVFEWGGAPKPGGKAAAPGARRAKAPTTPSRPRSDELDDSPVPDEEEEGAATP
jgi:ribosome maturation factor RimP